MDKFLFYRKLDDLHITLQDLADRLGISKQVLYLRVVGRRTMRREHIASISNELNLTKDEILDIFFPDIKFN